MLPDPDADQVVILKRIQERLARCAAAAHLALPAAAAAGAGHWLPQVPPPLLSVPSSAASRCCKLATALAVTLALMLPRLLLLLRAPVQRGPGASLH